MQGITPRQSVVPHVAMNPVHSTPSVALHALEKGPGAISEKPQTESVADISLMEHATVEIGFPTTHAFDLHDEIRYLQEKAHSEHLEDQREAVAGFARMAKHDAESARDYGLIGMLSVLELSENVGILSAVASNLILLLDPSALDGYHSDLFRFAFSILSGLSGKFDQLPEVQQNTIRQQLTQIDFVVQNSEIKEAIREFIKEPTCFRARMLDEDNLGAIEIPDIVSEPALPGFFSDGLAPGVTDKQDVFFKKEPVAVTSS